MAPTINKGCNRAIFQQSMIAENGFGSGWDESGRLW